MSFVDTSGSTQICRWNYFYSYIIFLVHSRVYYVKFLVREGASRVFKKIPCRWLWFQKRGSSRTSFTNTSSQQTQRRHCNSLYTTKARKHPIYSSRTTRHHSQHFYKKPVWYTSTSAELWGVDLKHMLVWRGLLCRDA